MLIRPYYIVKDVESLVTLIGEKNDTFIFAIEINLHDLPTIIEIYKNIYRFSNRFCILLNTTTDFTNIEPAIDYLVSLSFHYDFERPALNELLILTDFPDTTFQDYISNRFMAGGYEKIHFKNISDHFCLINDFKDIEEVYYNYLKTTGKDVILSFNQRPEAALQQQVNQHLENAENKLQKHEPALYNLLTLNVRARQTIENLNNKIRYYQEAIEAKNSYAAFNSGPQTGYRKQVKEIADFYYYEYEILPLWYKRLGHILKVLTGKRTMKSLFNDNVKKYTDKNQHDQ